MSGKNSFENFYGLNIANGSFHNNERSNSNKSFHLEANARQNFLSKIEEAILSSNYPIEMNDNIEEITINGEKGMLMNKSEIVEWKSHFPLSQYEINEDNNPDIIHKRTDQQIFYQQDLAIRYLRPPTPPPPGDIYIKQEDIYLPPAPPLVIRQQPARPVTPPPLVVREAPPEPPKNIERKIIYIAGKLNFYFFYV